MPQVISSGKKHWEVGNDTVYSIKQTSDGGFIAAGDSESDYFVVKLSAENLGVNDENLHEIKAYPNPTKGPLQFTEKLKEISVYDMSGKLVFKQDYASDYINISYLPKGNYILKANSEKQKNIVLKVILN